MWLIVSSTPQLPVGHVAYGSYDVSTCSIKVASGDMLSIERGTETLAATASIVCEYLNVPPPVLLCASDDGSGEGSRKAYAYFIENIKNIKPDGVTFHYLYPDVDWHNQILMQINELEKRPTLVADAGFMYVAKMSGYAEQYDLFTPDVGEMCFLADEFAPHPFYTQGFLLQNNPDIEELISRAKKSENIPVNLIVKGSTDHVVFDDKIVERISEPSVTAMEAIGGTGDLVTGLVTGLLAAGYPMQNACIAAVKTNRVLAALAKPTPATAVGKLMPFIQPALDVVIKH